MDILNFPGLTGWPATLVTLFGIAVYGWYVKRSSKSKAESIATEAYEKAINAMQAYMSILNKRVDDAEKESTRLGRIIDTIYAALKSRGIYVTIDGNMITIRDKEGSTTTQSNGANQD